MTNYTVNTLELGEFITESGGERLIIYVYVMNM